MGQYKSQYTGPQIDAGINAALNPDLVPTEGSDALITSDAVAKVQQGFAPIETAATSANSYAIGDLLVWGGVLYKAKTFITAGDSFVVDTNIEATTVADKLNNIDTEITSDTDTTLTGLLTGNGSKVGTKSLDTSGLTNDADHVPTSGVVKSAINSVENDIAIRVVGNKTTYASGAAIGQYVIVDGSTITGITDGLYKAAKAIPYNTVIDSTYLMAASGGGLNDLMSALPTVSYQSVASETWGTVALVKYGNVMLVSFTGNANTPADKGRFYDYTLPYKSHQRAINVSSIGADGMYMMMPNDSTTLRLWIGNSYTAWTNCSLMTIIKLSTIT